MSLPRPTRTTVLLFLPALALLLLVGYLTSCRSTVPPAAVQYHCPMHPDFVADAPGNCPICGMRLVPSERSGLPPPEPAAAASAVSAGAASGVPDHAPVTADAAALRLAGVRTAVAERRVLTRSVRTVGVVTADETRVRHVHTKISGWIEHLHVNFVGQPVRAGQPLLAIYSPQLLATQEEYLRAREAAGRFAGSSLPEVRQGGADLLSAARRRLELFDAPRSLLAALDRTGKPQRTVTLLAPASGYVTAKEVFEGMEVGPGMDLLTITDLSRVWVEADFYEFESRALGVGRPVTLSLPYDPAARFTGRVAFVYPTLDPASRTLRARIELANPSLQLKPGMYLDVIPELETREGVVVPDSAVLDTGVRQVVFVARGGTFEPREVRVGIRAGGEATILSGVAAGERVAVRANFLLDSESRLRAAVAGMSAPGHVHGGGAP